MVLADLVLPAGFSNPNPNLDREFVDPAIVLRRRISTGADSVACASGYRASISSLRLSEGALKLMKMSARRLRLVYSITTSLALLCAVLVATSASARSPANGDVLVTYYSITGDSQTELRASLDRERSLAITGAEYDAHTSWKVDWRFSYDRREGVCEIKNMTVTLEAHMILPRWDSPHRGKRSLQAAWLRYLNALRAHEDGHIEIARAAKSAIVDTVLTAPVMEDCAKLSDEVNSRAHAILETFREREAQYDRNTGHGLSQGARFP